MTMYTRMFSINFVKSLFAKRCVIEIDISVFRAQQKEIVNISHRIHVTFELSRATAFIKQSLLRISGTCTTLLVDVYMEAMLNPLMLTAVKNSLVVLVKSFWLKHN